MDLSFLYKISFLMGGGCSREDIQQNRQLIWDHQFPHMKIRHNGSIISWNHRIQGVDGLVSWVMDVLLEAQGHETVNTFQWKGIADNINKYVEVTNDDQLSKLQQQLFHLCHKFLNEEEGGESVLVGWGWAEKDDKNEICFDSKYI